MTSAADDFVAGLQDQIRKRHANLNHPFARLLIDGKLTKAQLRGWACQRYKGITGMGMRNVAPLFIKAPDEHVRRHIWELLGDESGYVGDDPSHSEWLFQFGAALGLSREEMEQAEPLPETVAVNSFFLCKLNLGTFLEGLMAMVAVESQNPQGFAAWAKSLQDHYGLKPEDLRFFLGHVEADSEESGHAGAAWEIVREHAATDEAQRQVRRAVADSLNVYWLSLDGIKRAYVDGA
jgi:coenzyme PQQ biosynthesis protein C